ncbi:MAG: hypothetical protein IKK92_10625 [Prevotella sp.]|nr:hypothetical protein [Aeriscardovia sp.]MBR6606297.1 hypothetical protein [Prevotella sp.]
MILKGQNFRIIIGTTCVGMATNCTVTLTNNVESATTKDVVGLADMPVMTNQSWQVQVGSLLMSDVGALLTSMKNLVQFGLIWDETSTTDNYSALGSDFARTGMAYLTDFTATFDDRTNSVKNLTFTGTGPLSKMQTPVVSGGSNTQTFTKGQFVRLFLSSDNTTAPSKVIAAARQLSLHVSMSVENSTTKDTEDNWQVQEPTALNYDISTSALVRGNDTITSAVTAQDLASIEDIYEAGTPVKWQIANVSGDNQRTKGSVIVSGSCLIQTLTINAENRAAATYQANMVGYGEYVVGA